MNSSPKDAVSTKPSGLNSQLPGLSELRHVETTLEDGGEYRGVLEMLRYGEYRKR